MVPRDIPEASANGQTDLFLLFEEDSDLDQFPTYNELIAEFVDSWTLTEVIERRLPCGMSLASDEQARKFIASPQTIADAVEKLSHDAHSLLHWFTAIGPRVSEFEHLPQPCVLDPCCWPRRASRQEVLPALKELERSLLIIRDTNNPATLYVPFEVMEHFKEDLENRRKWAARDVLPAPLLLRSAEHMQAHSSGPSALEIYNGLCQTVTVIGAITESVKYERTASVGGFLPNVSELTRLLRLPPSSYQPFNPTLPHGVIAELLARAYETEHGTQLPIECVAVFGLGYTTDPLKSWDRLLHECAQEEGTRPLELGIQQLFRHVEMYYRDLFRDYPMPAESRPETFYGDDYLRLERTYLWKKDAVYLGRLFSLRPDMSWRLSRFKVQQWVNSLEGDYTVERFEQLVNHDEDLISTFDEYRDAPAFNPRYQAFNNSDVEDPYFVCSIDPKYDNPDTTEDARLEARLTLNSLLAQEAPALSAREKEELWDCLTDPYREVWIDYCDDEGAFCRHRVGRIWLDEDRVVGDCVNNGDTLEFQVGQISGIYEADIPDFDIDDLE